MKYNSIIKKFYQEHRVPSPVNFTFTQRQVVDGQWISDEVSQQNFKHFANLLNSQIYGKAFNRLWILLKQLEFVFESILIFLEEREGPNSGILLSFVFYWTLLHQF